MNDYRNHPNERIRAQVLAQLGETSTPATPKRGRRVRTWDPELSAAIMARCGLPAPETEYLFHPVRRWRFDFAWPDALVYLEVEGGIYTEGAHGSISGALRDIEKYNAAAALGWTGIRALPEWLPGDRGLSIDGELVANLTTLINLKTPNRENNAR